MSAPGHLQPSSLQEDRVASDRSQGTAAGRSYCAVSLAIRYHVQNSAIDGGIPLKVVYLGRESRRSNSLPQGDEDTIELLSNNWNDYGYETTFMTVCRVKGERLELGSIRLLIADQSNSRRFLNDLLTEGWDGAFPIPNVDYLSTPSEIAFYEQLDGVLLTSATQTAYVGFLSLKCLSAC